MRKIRQRLRQLPIKPIFEEVKDNYLSRKVALYSKPVVLARISIVPVVQKPPVISVRRNVKIFQSQEFGFACVGLAATLLNKALSPHIPPVLVVSVYFLKIYDVLRF